MFLPDMILRCFPKNSSVGSSSVASAENNAVCVVVHLCVNPCCSFERAVKEEVMSGY